ncbi:DJ-1/PfpI family protein [Nocardioides pantholopis]|uniref:DJ-1/PfpI family protein n=1 Tax=Nocardioides pantholopis TaxID=2483798 RepID=UPI001F15089A|nr:DJ-1/PfpI family protein [Nocardioides pantholopis]
MTSTRTVAILAFDDMEVLDYAGPYEVFNVAGEVSDPGAFSVLSVGLTGEVATGRGGFRVLPDHGLDDCPATDLLVVPGGAGVRRLQSDDRLLAWLRDRAAEVEVLVSVCTGALLLASAGLLHGRRATTHHTAYAELAGLDPTVQVERGPRFVRSADRLWTSGGISAGIDLSLRVVRELAGPRVHDDVVAEMEWGWRS